MSTRAHWSLAFVFVALAATPAAAQPDRLELGGGIAFLSSDRLTDGYAGGWFIDGGWRLAPGLSAVVTGGRHRVTQDVGFFDTEVTFDTALVGARYRFEAGGMRPFVQVLVGRGRVGVTARATSPIDTRGDDDATHVTLQLGGGVEAPLSGSLRLRVGVDYRRVEADTALNQIAISSGAVFGF